MAKREWENQEKHNQDPPHTSLYQSMSTSADDDPPSDGVLQEVKEELRKDAETLQEVKQAIQRPWWRTGRFLFPLGMLGRSQLATLTARAHLRAQLEYFSASPLSSHRTFRTFMRSCPFS
jgi:hypothetical protein